MTGIRSTVQPGAGCPTCNGQGRVYGLNPLPWADGKPCGDCDGAGYLRCSRRMTRSAYDYTRADAHRMECEAGLLRYSHPRDSQASAAAAAVLRAEISAPWDHKEAERNRRWHKLTAALIAARSACAQLRAARSLARAA